MIAFPIARVKKRSCGNCFFGFLLKGKLYCAEFNEFLTVDHGPDCDFHERETQ